MKNVYLFLILCLSVSLAFGQAKQQGEPVLRFNTYALYTFQDSFDSYYDYGSYYNGQLQDGLLWGGGLEFPVRDGVSAEVLYLRMDTTAPTEYYGEGLFNNFSNLDVALNYIMVGGTKSFRKPDSKVEGFIGGMAGVSVIDVADPTKQASRNFTKFAWGLKGGAIIWATEKVGLKLQAQLLSVVQSTGGGFYFGTGGSGAGISFASSIYQFSLGGGLTFNLGEK